MWRFLPRTPNNVLAVASVKVPYTSSLGNLQASGVNSSYVVAGVNSSLATIPIPTKKDEKNFGEDQVARNLVVSSRLSISYKSGVAE